MFTQNSPGRRRCSMVVPLLVGQFNDIIEWKEKIVQNELEQQTQRAQNFCNYERRYSCSNDNYISIMVQRESIGNIGHSVGVSSSGAASLQRSATDSTLNGRHSTNDDDDDNEDDNNNDRKQFELEQKQKIEQWKQFRQRKRQQEQEELIKKNKENLLEDQSTRKPRIIRLKKSKTQQCFSNKFNFLKKEVIANTIQEQTEVEDSKEPEVLPCIAESDDIEHRISNNLSEENEMEKPIQNQQVNDSIIKDEKSQIPLDQVQKSTNEEEIKFKEEESNRPVAEQIGKESEKPSTPLSSPSPEPPHAKLSEHAQQSPTLALPMPNPEPAVYTFVESSTPDLKHPQPSISATVESSSPDPEPSQQPEILKPIPLMTNLNPLLEKLAGVYRHQFEVKTSVSQNGIENGLTIIMSHQSRKDTRSSTHCFCGEAFKFSEKYLRCLNCCTGCHTACASLLPRPCIRYVDSFLRPSKLITNYVYPRSKPSIPFLLINCCREIEIRCQNNFPDFRSISRKNSISVSTFELYYLKSEMLKPVKEQCKQILQQSKFGFKRLDGINLDHLCGMVKYFLGEMIEPLFPKSLWKEISTIIQKKSDDELKRELFDMFRQFTLSTLHTICFILIHLKHLIRCSFQDMDILADIFCPIVMGEIELKRKIRLFKLMLELDEQKLLNLVEL